MPPLPGSYPAFYVGSGDETQVLMLRGKYFVSPLSVSFLPSLFFFSFPPLLLSSCLLLSSPLFSFSLLFSFEEVGMERGALSMLDKHSTTELHLQP